MLHEHVEFFERIMIEQKFDAFAGGKLAPGVLRVDALLAASEARAFAAFVEDFENVFHEDFPVLAECAAKNVGPGLARLFWGRNPQRDERMKSIWLIRPPPVGRRRAHADRAA
jgi:hypothetical protein